MPFREKGIPTVLQIENYEAERNPSMHTPDDTTTAINVGYLLEHIKLTAAMAADLGGPAPLP